MSNEIVPYSDIEKMGTAISKSGLFGLKTPEQAVALMLVAQALGKHPALAAMEYNIIQGRPAKKAEAIQADFQSAGGKIEWHCLTDEKAEATFSHPSGGLLKLDWTIDRAKKANLYDKDGSMYKKYPRQMLKARLVADGVRAVYPAAMGGVRAVEEMDDDTPSDPSKSRLDTIIDAQAEPTKKPEPVKGEVEQVTQAPLKTVELKEGEKLAQGFIMSLPKSANIEGPDGKPVVKYSFPMGDNNYGTIERSVADAINEVVKSDLNEGKKTLLNVVYKDRVKNGKVFHDIVRFEIATMGSKPMPI